MIHFTTVVVTYADRGHLLSRVTSAAIESGSNHVIVIDNGSSEKTKAIIVGLSNKFQGVKFTISTNDKNEGSAIAFSAGMDIASSDQNENEMVLFLDDDNLPEAGSVQRALQIALSRVRNDDVYFLLREDRPHYMEFIRTKNKDVLLGKKNSFMAFSITKYINQLLKKTIKLTEDNVDLKDSDCVLDIPCGPYGGMLTRKSILEKGVRPLKEMILYFDDTKYTYDLSSSGVNLNLLTNCYIKDIDDSWSAVKTKITSSPLFNAGDFKIYHTIRNRVFFELNVTTSNLPIYVMNIFGYMTILLIKATLSGNLKAFMLITRSIFDGFEFHKKKAR